MSYVEHLIALVGEYGLQEREDGGSTREPRSFAAQALFDRITALLSQQPVQAHDVHGALLWISENGGVVHHGKSLPGPWRPLLVGGDGVR